MPWKGSDAQRAYNREYQKEWYKRNREKHKADARRNRKRYKEEWLKFKAEIKCAHCGERHPAIIDFHHVIKENKQNVWELIGTGRYGAARKEISEKCIPLCANCHRKLHWEEHHGVAE